MFKPTQYEDIHRSTIVIGADIIQKLNRKSYNIEDLFTEIRIKKDININQFLNIITFLWLVDAIEYTNLKISLKNKDVSE